MRLIDVGTLEIKTFSEQNIPDHAILSHTWGPDEVTLQELFLITRMRSVSQSSSGQQSRESYDGDTMGSHDSRALMAAVELLMNGGWGVGMNVSNMSEEALMLREGYRKIIHSAKEAKNLGYQWIWIDVCLPPLEDQR